MEPSSSRRTPILVTGAHRSGTTWVGKMLALSDEVGYIHEPFGKRRNRGITSRPFQTWYPYVKAGSVDASDLRRSLERTLDFEFGVMRGLRSLRSVREARPFVEAAAEFRTARKGSLRPLVKDPMALLCAEWVAHEFGAEVIVMIRHPAAFASSLERLQWNHPFDDFLRQSELMNEELAPFASEISKFAQRRHPVIDQAILLWRILYSVVARYVDEHRTWKFVRHEDISTEPVTAFAHLYSRLGLSWTDAVANEIVAHTSDANPSEPGSPAALRRDTRENAANWRRRLSPAAVDQIRAGVADVSPRFYGEEDW
jgi:hypothetical protein